MVDQGEAEALLVEVREIAERSGEILMRHFRRLDGYEKKGAIDLVTAADREAEDFIRGEVLRRFPDHAILGEEGGRHGNPEAEWLWVVDPLDGTTNFAHGLRMFATSVGVLYRGRPMVGAICAPALDEMYTAAAGCGAMRNGQTLRVSSTDTLQDSLIVTGFPYNRAEVIDELMGMMRGALMECRGVLRLGAASLDFAAVASGHMEAFYELGLKPWDMAAGVLLVAEAGGRVTDLAPDREFDLFGNAVLATNGAMHDALQAVLEASRRGASA